MFKPRLKDGLLLFLIFIPAFVLLIHSYHLSQLHDDFTDANRPTAPGFISHFHTSSSSHQDHHTPQLLRPQAFNTPEPVPFRLLLRYTVCGGLINQHYAHISALMIAQALGAEVVLPLACYRESFGQHFSLHTEENEMKWYSAPLETLVDVDRLVDVWRDWGLIIHKTPPDAVLPDQSAPQTAFPVFNSSRNSHNSSSGLDMISSVSKVDSRLIVKLDSLYRKTLPLMEVVNKAKKELLAKHQTARSKHEDLKTQKDRLTLSLDLPCTFFAIRTNDTETLPIAAAVAASLEFPPHLRALADKASSVMTSQGRAPYNGVHLRVEKDAEDWALIMGGPGVVWHQYLALMLDMGFNNHTPLYVASGLFSYEDETSWEMAQGLIKGRGLASYVLCKERFVPNWELKTLHPEQLALVDLLILRRATAFVGFISSTFSHYIKEYRALHGVGRHSTALVNSTRFKTIKLFDAAGLIAPL